MISEYDSNNQPFEPDILRALSAAEVTDIHIDTPEYKKARYEMNIPSNADLIKIVKVHNYLNEHEGEAMTQAMIGNAVGLTQSMVSDVMTDYPSYFKGQNKTYITLRLIPTEWIEAYNAAMNGKPIDATVQQNPPRPVDKQMLKLLNKIAIDVETLTKQTQTEQEQSEAKSPVNKSMRRPHLDDAIIDKVLQWKTIREDTVGIEHWTIENKVKALYMLIRDLEAMIPETMEIVSRNIRKQK